jgi:hypothetical protein
MGDQARARVEGHFGVERMVDEWEALLRALSRRGAPA